MLPRLVLATSLVALAACPSPSGGDPFGNGTAGPVDTTGPTGSGTTGPGTTVAATTAADGGSTAATTGGGVLLDVGPGMTSTGPDTGPCEGGPAPTIPAVACSEVGIAVEPPFDTYYLCRDLGPVPGVQPEVGGVTFSLDDDDVLWIGGRANHVQGRLYSIAVTRDAACHVNGFADATATEIGTAPYNDGGFAYGPGQVLFVAQWPQNALSQYLPGNTDPDLVTALGTFGIGPDSIAGLNFVPPTFPGEGQLKVVTWPGGDWFTVDIAPDGTGTYDVVSATPGPQLGGGPEGFVHISADNVGVDVESILVAEWLDGSVGIYDADANGDPLPATRRDFINGLEGALGAHIDRVGGDFLFTTFGGGDRLIAIRGFLPNPTPEG